MRKKLIICLLLFLSIGARSQTFSTTLLKKFESYRESSIHEKVFVVTDRQLYLTGELIWFSLYCVDATLHKPSDVSKVAYVEILNRSHEPVLQAKIKLENGVGGGSFFVPTALPSENYLLRAYTNWMKNLAPQYYFHKVISLVNPFVQIEPVSKKGTPTRIEFFPEGGSLVGGVSTRIAYRAVGSSSENPAHAFLVNNKRDTLIRFPLLNEKPGGFEFVPDLNEKYQVVIKTKDKTEFQDFVSVGSSGYNLKLSDGNDFIEISVTHSGNQEFTEQDLTLFVHSRNRITKNETKRTTNRKVSFKLNREEILDGVSHFTVFGEKGEVLGERLYFKKPTSDRVSIEVNKLTASARTKNSFKLLNTVNAFRGTVSVSKVDSIPSPPSPLLLDYFVLNADLDVDEQSVDLNNWSREEIDNLLITSHWKRFSWADILNAKSELKFLPESRDHVIRAKVSDQSGTPRGGVIVYLSSPGKVGKFYNAKTGSNGEVSFEVRDFYGDQKVYMQTNRLIDSTSVVKIENPFSNEFADISLPELKLLPKDEKYLLGRSVQMQVQNIFFGDFESTFVQVKTDSLPFYGKADEVYKLDDYTRFPVMEEVMREYVPGVVVRNKEDGFNFFVLDKKNNLLFRGTPLILLDGVPIFDPDEIMQFDPLKITRLEVVTAKYFYGSLELPGIVNYISYNGDLSGFQLRSKNAPIDYEGLKRERKFYIPKHDDHETRMPDPRYLLYWNTKTLTSSNSIEFFTSDVPGAYMIKVQGISGNGQPIEAVATFTVDKN